MSILQNLIVVSLLPLFFWGGTEERTLKEVRIDMSIGYYHLATVRLERLLKEYPKSQYRREMLPLIIKSYVLSKREQEAIPHLLAYTREYPNDAAALNPKYLSLLPVPPPIPDDNPVSVNTSTAAPPAPVIEKKNSPILPDVSEKPVGIAHSAEKAAAPPVRTIILETQPAEMLQAAPTPAPDATKREMVSTQQVVASPAEGITAQTPGSGAGHSTIVTENTAVSPSAPVQAAEPGDSVAFAESVPQEYYTLSSGEIIDSGAVTRMSQKLREADLKPFVSEGKRSIVMHRLVEGCYPTNNAALQRKSELAGLSKGVFIFREKNAFCTAAGSFREDKIVAHERRRLAAQGIVAKIIPFHMDIPFWNITVGWFPDAATAQMAQQRFLADGLRFNVQLVKK